MLCQEAVVEFIDRNFVFWAADVTSAAGYETAASLRVTSFPFIGLLHAGEGGPGRGGMEVRALGSLIGPQSVDELVAGLLGLLEEHDGLLAADRMAREERERTRNLLREQDADYEASLAADRQRIQQLEEKDEEAENVAAVAAAMQQEEDASSSSVVADETRRLPVPDEPGVGEANVILVAVRLPEGRMERRFRRSDPVAALFAFVDSKTDWRGGYVLVSAYPRRVYRRDDARTLDEAEFEEKTALIYEEDD